MHKALSISNFILRNREALWSSGGSIVSQIPGYRQLCLVRAVCTDVRTGVMRLDAPECQELATCQSAAVQSTFAWQLTYASHS